MAKYSFEDENNDLYALWEYCKKNNINFSKMVVGPAKDALLELGFSKYVNKYAVARNDNKKTEKDAKGKIKKVNKVKPPQESVDMLEAETAIGWKTNRVYLKFRVEDKDGVLGRDVYKHVKEIWVENGYVKFVEREGLKSKQRKLKDALHSVCDPFMCSVALTGMETTIKYFYNNPGKLLKTVWNMSEIENMTRDGWMSKYNVVRNDVVLDKFVGTVYEDTVRVMQALLYMRYKEEFIKMSKKTRHGNKFRGFDNARIHVLNTRVEDIKKTYCKETEKSFGGKVLELLTKLSVENKKKGV